MRRQFAARSQPQHGKPLDTRTASSSVDIVDIVDIVDVPNVVDQRRQGPRGDP
jgi:hypothetical protein